MRIKEQEKRLTLNEHDVDDDIGFMFVSGIIIHMDCEVLDNFTECRRCEKSYYFSENFSSVMNWWKTSYFIECLDRFIKINKSRKHILMKHKRLNY